MKATCKNSANLEQETKTTKIVTYPLLSLASSYAQIFVLGHYLFLVAQSFPRASLSENCSLLGTDNVRGQISEHIFAPNGHYCLDIFSANKTANWLKCVDMCSHDVRCQSFDYVISQRICELNNRTKEARTEDFFSGQRSVLY